MILLFRVVPRYMQSDDTHWFYGRYGTHEVPPGENPNFFAVRGTIASSVEDLWEVVTREMEANPR